MDVALENAVSPYGVAMQTILLIDPFHSGRYLMQKLQRLGFDVQVVRTKDVRSTYFCDEFLYDEDVLVTTGDLQRDCDYIREATQKRHLVHGLAGTEASLEYSDRLLSELFPTQWNDPKTTSLRFRKSAMQDALAKHKLPAIDTVTLKHGMSNQHKKSAISEFYKRHSGEIIVKPDASICSAGFRIPSSEDEILSYMETASHVMPLFDEMELLLQRRVRGRQYFANTVSYNGNHHLCSVGEARKEFEGGNVKEIYKELVDLEAFDSFDIAGYIFAVLDALDVKFGLSHIEFCCDGNDCYLIELNPRIAGLHGALNRMSAGRYTEDQIDVYRHYLTGKLPIGSRHGIHRSGNHQTYRTVYLYNLNPQRYQLAIALFGELESAYFCEKLKLSEASGTTNLMDVSMFVILSHNDQRIIEHDMRELLKLSHVH
ncbi:Uncharacterised protein [BD1-7 clade bacterium]|uniref:ATP-grasp domain-containing protein n=1 Tax=BD1-7 clade bacterium TaxID=2029982 RepID=A0A5S9NP49_9GAMM|nr:Uncharacterised protein [BD1-7 clade bacterium]